MLPPDLTARPALYPSARIVDCAPLPTTPSVGIILRTRDRPWFLARALAGIVAQSWPHWRVHLVNDAGDAALVEATIAPFRTALDGRISVIHLGTRHHMARATNAALRVAREDLLVVHDDDDSWEADYLTATTAFLADPAHAGFVAVATGCTLVEERITDSGIETVRLHAWPHMRGTVDFQRAMVDLQVPPIALTFRRAGIDLIGGQNEWLTHLADLEMLHRMLLLGEVGFIDRPLANYHHRQHGTAGAAGNSVVEARAAREEQHLRLRNGMARAALTRQPELIGLLQPLLRATDEVRQAVDASDARLAGALDERDARLAAALEERDVRLAAVLDDTRAQLARQDDHIRALVTGQEAQAALLHAIAARLAAQDRRRGVLEAVWQGILPLRRTVARLRGRVAD